MLLRGNGHYGTNTRIIRNLPPSLIHNDLNFVPGDSKIQLIINTNDIITPWQPTRGDITLAIRMPSKSLALGSLEFNTWTFLTLGSQNIGRQWLMYAKPAITLKLILSGKKRCDIKWYQVWISINATFVKCFGDKWFYNIPTHPTQILDGVYSEYTTSDWC